MSDKERENEKPLKAKERGKSYRQPSRAVILGALAAGGVFQLNGWQVQAHGNRSSHTVSQVSSVVFTADDYVMMRQASPELDTTSARRLAVVKEQLRNATFRKSVDSPEVRRLQTVKAELEGKLHLTPTARQGVDFVRQGDVDAAIAVIEGEGWATRVLSEYTWTLIGVANLGTASHMNEFLPLAKAAMVYSDKALSSLPPGELSAQDKVVTELAAEIYHNVASFTLPEDGAANAAALQVGRHAAEQSLALRQRLHQDEPIMIGYLTLGKHYMRANQPEKARAALESSLRIATRLNNLPGIGWSKAELAKVVQKTDMKMAQNLRADAKRIAEHGQSQDATLLALHVELESR
jgi:hypothetical protein